jgi:hypothetical protein
VIMQTLVSFLASNPWILAISTLSMLWPIVQGIFKVYMRGLNWIADRVSTTNEDVNKSIEYPSYFLAIIVTYAVYVAAMLWLREGIYLISEVVKKYDSMPYLIARSLLTALSALVSVLAGLLIGAIIALSARVRREIANKSQVPDT